MKNRFNTDLCNDTMSFQDCELAILRNAVDESDKIQGEKVANSEDVKKIISIVEDFLMKKKLICYGGTAINNILPNFAQFYNRELEVPDYDFFSNNALDDAKELADIYFAEGYNEVEAKSGMHKGTFKVFVNFIPVADITYLEDELYESIKKESIIRAGIRYAPPNFLRMSMYLELSRPMGDVSRWEKVLKRLNLLNKYYPLKTTKYCNMIDFQRKMESNVNDSEELYLLVRNTLIDQGVIFFGGFASNMYSKYMQKYQKRLIEKIPDFDVLSLEPEKCATILVEQLHEQKYKNIKQIHHEEIGEVIPERIEIRVGKDTVAFIYKPIACHNYNTITMDDKEIHIATIDTMLSFYLAFIYTNKIYFNKDRILCMAKFLFEVEEQNRLEQKGLLKRFNIHCYGKQATLESIRSLKAEKFKELMNKRGTREYEMWFLKYNPFTESDKKLKESSPVEKPKKTRRVVAKKNTTKKNKLFDYLHNLRN
jgi:hypothetical protein